MSRRISVTQRADWGFDGCAGFLAFVIVMLVAAGGVWMGVYALAWLLR